MKSMTAMKITKLRKLRIYEKYGDHETMKAMKL